MATTSKEKIFLIAIPAIKRRGTLYDDIDAAFEDNSIVQKTAPDDYVPDVIAKHDNTQVRLEPQQRKLNPTRCNNASSISEIPIGVFLMASHDGEKQESKRFRVQASVSYGSLDKIDPPAELSPESDTTDDKPTVEKADWVKSIAARLPGKKGRMRSTMLGKRADVSVARSRQE